MKARRVTGVFRLAAALLCCAAPIAAANAADRIAIKIDVIGPLGMRVLEMHSLLEAEENPGRYAVSVDYATTGLAGMVVDQKTYAVAHGQLVPGSAIPASFRNHTSRNGVERDSQVRYSADGTVQGSSNPPPSNDCRPYGGARHRRQSERLSAAGAAARHQGNLCDDRSRLRRQASLRSRLYRWRPADAEARRRAELRRASRLRAR